MAVVVFRVIRVTSFKHSWLPSLLMNHGEEGVTAPLTDQARQLACTNCQSLVYDVKNVPCSI